MDINIILMLGMTADLQRLAVGILAAITQKQPATPQPQPATPATPKPATPEPQPATPEPAPAPAPNPFVPAAPAPADEKKEGEEITDGDIARAVERASGSLLRCEGATDAPRIGKAFIACCLEIANSLRPGCKPTTLPQDLRRKFIQELTHIKLNPTGIPVWEAF